jgi:itaconyl-CoA hydratase
MKQLKEGWKGRFLEDFKIGDVYQSRIGRTVNQYDNVMFTLLSNNTNQIHFNSQYAERAGHKKPLVNSIVTLAIVAGLGVTDISENGFALGWDRIELSTPVYEGDTLYSESEVIEVRPSKSRPTQGIVKVRTRGINQDGKIVIDYVRSVMVWKTEFAPLQSSFPTIQET